MRVVYPYSLKGLTYFYIIHLIGEWANLTLLPSISFLIDLTFSISLTN
nr:MAG TPA: hypothetical protein [Caudoviricetes sp.]